MHSSSRRIPFLGAPGRYTHWRDCLPPYERELANFRRNLKVLEGSGPRTQHLDRPALPGISAKLTGPGESFHVEPGARLYADKQIAIAQIAPKLRGLTGIRIAQDEAAMTGVQSAV
ncbi:MAG: hypothetical protein LAQ69_11490 [Acidobacteriia bacterium]|nr:hypothetical protein [Terriglobia bacterium]